MDKPRRAKRKTSRPEEPAAPFSYPRRVPEVKLSDRPLFIVWRAAPGVPPGFMPRDMEGRWDHRPQEPPLTLDRKESHRAALAIRTGRIEHRDQDGASAEVWEVHPVGGNYDPDPANRIPLW